MMDSHFGVGADPLRRHRMMKAATIPRIVDVRLAVVVKEPTVALGPPPTLSTTVISTNIPRCVENFNIIYHHIQTRRTGIDDRLGFAKLVYMVYMVFDSKAVGL